MNKMPDGQLLDAMGIWTADQIPKRYGLKKLIIAELALTDDQECFRGDIDEEDPWRYAISAIRQFTHEPYGSPEFREKSLTYISEIDSLERSPNILK